MNQTLILFEVLGYSDLAAYESRDFNIVAEYLTKEDAIKIAEQEQGDYHMYKVQSLDREEIYIYLDGECE